MQQVCTCQNKRNTCTKQNNIRHITDARRCALTALISYYKDKHWTHNDRQGWEYIHRYISFIREFAWHHMLTLVTYLPWCVFSNNYVNTSIKHRSWVSCSESDKTKTKVHVMEIDDILIGIQFSNLSSHSCCPISWPSWSLVCLVQRLFDEC